MRPLLAKSAADPVQELFAVRKQGILPTTPSPPLRCPTTRRLIMAGVRISNKGGFTLQQSRRPGKEVVLAAKIVEKMVGRMLRITRDDNDVIEATLDDFTTKFSDQLALELIVAMRDFFHLDDPVVNGIEDALLAHGGEGALDLAQMGDVAVQDA
ncbi:hypothetical protein D1007_36230 [Hordeum vulgare]|nr:hypothetical protein D1007_36230 [Hordeum vulgare]